MCVCVCVCVCVSVCLCLSVCVSVHVVSSYCMLALESDLVYQYNKKKYKCQYGKDTIIYRFTQESTNTRPLDTMHLTIHMAACAS